MMMESQKRIDEIRRRLTQAFSPVTLNIQDDSADHVGHGATGGHYTVKIVAEAFSGQSIIDRHRMVYRALGELMEEEVHALSIRAETPQE